ncbi:bacterial regulatory helix-turn-helix, lysR family protein [Collimonas arenae]|uniref:Bacterial regulatory helix-turn-helix, lysR family protein n=1 Tax=Collimonas arenae TaxID=279058 RepID=A0A127PR42_9BURK|nr:LysR family transcriptional regulator [Collimonas arenae]AMP00209.1 bacterial regulatory helix-turn-helix, lysR family protein [Collimonas arenae]AMP10081.1 bacterial regulatory helix-turn-helix, lysR family protein [Collimonas arenae]
MNMNFDLGDLRAFVAVAELGSFRAAADSIHLSQPALSRRVEKLEIALGVRLFERTTRSVSLTAVGKDFSRKARTLLDDLENSLLSMHEVAASQVGEVVIACVPSAVYYFLPNVLRAYREQYPKIRVRIIDDSANAVLESVARGEADFGINIIGTQEPAIDFQVILKESFVAACRRDHPLAKKRKVTWAELGQHDFMTVDKSSGNRLLMDLALANTDVRLSWCYEARHVSTLLGMVETGLGVAVVPRLSMPQGEHATLTSVQLVEPSVDRTVGLIRRRGHELPPSARQLYQMIEKTSPRRSRQ